MSQIKLHLSLSFLSLSLSLSASLPSTGFGCHSTFPFSASAFSLRSRASTLASSTILATAQRRLRGGLPHDRGDLPGVAVAVDAQGEPERPSPGGDERRREAQGHLPLAQQRREQGSPQGPAAETARSSDDSHDPGPAGSQGDLGGAGEPGEAPRDASSAPGFRSGWISFARLRKAARMVAASRRGWEGSEVEGEEEEGESRPSSARAERRSSSSEGRSTIGFVGKQQRLWLVFF